MDWLLLIVIGFFACLAGSLMGLGSGIIIVPALMILSAISPLLTDITPQTAVGTSVLIMIVTGLSSTIAYIRQKKVDYKSALIFFSGSGPGALIGVWLNKGVDGDPFLIIFGTFMIIVSFGLVFRKKLKPLRIRGKGIRRYYKDEAGSEIEYGFTPCIAISLGLFVGLCSGLFGIGGGSILVPAMIVLFGFPPHRAVATSMLMVFLSAIVSSLSHIALGNIDWGLVLALIPGAWVGAQIGAEINRRLKSDTLVVILRIFLIFVGIRLIWQGVTGI
ncbi:sulfite exporter TauE/SafE family protein [Alteribacillus sp. HJP-4]|uniref:sulfite exporter TauE/SafE family protein n=1 Tax=Alteribacillus sp. HJP-4 TaxID=2775394 RepID=UPI0035CD2F78